MTDNLNSNGYIGRTVPLDLAKLLSFLAELGWTNAELADRVGVPSRTIERIVKRRTASRKVYSEILQAIRDGIRERRKQSGICDDSLQHPQSLELACESDIDRGVDTTGLDTLTLTNTAFVEITIDGDFNSFSQEKQNEYLAVIQDFLKSENKPKVMQIRRGSIKMTLRVEPYQAERLVWGIKGGQYESIGITDADLIEVEVNDSAVRQPTVLDEPSIVEVTVPPLSDHRQRDQCDSTGNNEHECSPYLAWKSWPIRLLGAGLLVLACPMILVLALLVRATSRGPALFRQSRVGRDGKLFSMYKLRTMYVDVESMNGPMRYRPNDLRITRFGRLLRLLHLDELPQLINIVRGEMDLIGPRPERPAFVELLSREVAGYSERLSVLPGITGLAQVLLPPAESIDCVRWKLELDREYIRKASFGLDVRIVLCTFLRILGIRMGRATRLCGLMYDLTASHNSGRV